MLSCSFLLVKKSSAGYLTFLADEALELRIHRFEDEFILGQGQLAERDAFDRVVLDEENGIFDAFADFVEIDFH